MGGRLGRPDRDRPGHHLSNAAQARRAEGVIRHSLRRTRRAVRGPDDHGEVGVGRVGSRGEESGGRGVRRQAPWRRSGALPGSREGKGGRERARRAAASTGCARGTTETAALDPARGEDERESQ